MDESEGGPSTRERILRSALDLAGRNGLEGLTTRRVAQAAGVNLGLLHYYFASKEALVAETLDLFMRELSATFRTLRPGEGGLDPQELLSEIIMTALGEAWKRPGLLFGLIGRISVQVSEAAKGGPGKLGDLATAPPSVVATVVSAQTALVKRVGAILAMRLGDDEGLIRRRSLQVFASTFHPILFTPFPRLVFGVDVLDPAGREAYIRAVVADALRLA